MSYGLQPTPSSIRASQAPTLSELEHGGVHYIRFTWVDLSNTIRYRVIPIQHFLALTKSPRPGIAIARTAPGIVFNTSAPAFNSVGEVLYAPDMASVAWTPYAKGHASVMGWFQEKDANLEKGKVSKASGVCPRSLLKRIVDDASNVTSTEFLVGFESEFILLLKTADGSTQAVNNHPWSSSRALLSGTVEAQALEEMVEALTQASITVEMYHAEAAPGQYEIVTGPLPPLQAADALIRTRETIVNVAARHGLRATFSPRVYNDNCGSACHSHISVHDKTGSSTNKSTHVQPSQRPQPALTTKEASFLAGVLAHLPALCALTLPTVQSYARVADGVWSGGTYVSYGTDNREAPLRVCGARGARHFELKALDGTANPYVALAGVLGTGARAIAEGRRLEMGECRDMPAALMSEEERVALGVTERLPRSIAEARVSLEKDELVMDVLGETGKVWVGVSETLEKCLQVEADKVGGDLMRIMIDNY